MSRSGAPGERPSRQSDATEMEQPQPGNGPEEMKRGGSGRPTIIRVESAYDPNARMMCCGQPAEQRQIPYELTVNGERFRVQRVWASVCNNCHDVYFAPPVGSAIMDKIFKRQHPVPRDLLKRTI